MDLALALERASGHKLIIHKGQVFFNTWEEEIAQRWQEAGATIIPFYGEAELKYLSRRKTRQGWEVHLLPAIEPRWRRDESGELTEITREVLLSETRKLVQA